MDRHVVIGMSGHIDHGKTAIIRCLTGTDTDRLKEEKERGITTDLGFAFLGREITMIDVPGHEKFVKTMVAGVNTVDMAVLVIAADDGIMPQTIEHLEILNLLQIKKAIVALNKIDKVDPEWVSLVADDIKERLKGTSLEGAPIIKISALEKTGIEELRTAILDMASKIPPRPDGGLFRMFVDRVFTIKGFGTVVGGTVLSGKLVTDDSVELLPAQKTLRVRRIQVHNETVTETKVGFRAALNVMGVEKSDIERGDVLAEPGYCHSTYMLDAKMILLSSCENEFKQRTRVRVNLGTSEVIARITILDKEEIRPGEESYVQLCFEKEVSAQRGDRYVIRSYSPIATIGGGVILDAQPRRHKKLEEATIERLRRIDNGDPSQSVLDFIARSRFIPVDSEEVARALSINPGKCLEYFEKLDSEGEIKKVSKKKVVTVENFEMLRKKYLSELKNYFELNPHKSSLAVASLRSSVRQKCDVNLAKAVIDALVDDQKISLLNDKVIPQWHSVTLTDKLIEIRNALESDFLHARFSPPSHKDLIDKFGKDAQIVIDFLVDSNKLVFLEEGVLYSVAVLDDAVSRILAAYSQSDMTIDIAHFREVFDGVSRKYVVYILDFADRIGLTRRVGEGRLLLSADAYQKFLTRQ